MVVSPLYQAMVVSVLAYVSGLFLGISFYRGEIGPRRRGQGVITPVKAPERRGDAPAAPSAERRRSGRGRRSFERMWYRLEHRARGIISVIIMLAVLLAVAIAVYTLLISLPAKPVR